MVGVLSWQAFPGFCKLLEELASIHFCTGHFSYFFDFSVPALAYLNGVLVCMQYFTKSCSDLLLAAYSNSFVPIVIATRCLALRHMCFVLFLFTSDARL